MIKTERLNGPNPDVDFDETLEEFRFKKDAVLTKTTHKELAVGNINDSTGQVDPNFDVANDGTTTLRGFQWSYDSNNEELVFSDPDGIELMRHPKAGSTQFLQGIDVAFPFTAPEDGLTNFVNANNTTATSSGTTVGYTFSVDNQTVAQVSADSDGSGGIGDGKFVVRQAGGTVGTDEVQIYHNGTWGNVSTGSGFLILNSDDGNVRLVDGDDQFVQLNRSNSGFEPSGSGISLGTAGGNPWENLLMSGNILDSSSNEILSFTSVSAAVNEIDVANAATGNAPTISATGSDADVDLALDFKGAGAINLPSNNTADTSGDIQIRDGSSGDLFSLPGDPAAKYEGSGAFTIGRRTGTIGGNSIVLGGVSVNKSQASGKTSIAGGVGSTASGETALAIGRVTTASGTASVAFGSGTTASGGWSFTANTATEASGDYSVAMNDQTIASGQNSSAFGRGTTAAGAQSFTGGRNSSANAARSFAFGDQLIANSMGGFVVGDYNEDYLGSVDNTRDSSDRMFVVGTGSSGSREDGFYVTFGNGSFVKNKLNLIDNNTADTSGDIQIRDDSSGDLFSLDDGSSPRLQAAYEGSKAFTFGYRSNTVGEASFVTGGYDIFGGNVGNEASGQASFAAGQDTTSSGKASFSAGNASVASGDYSAAIGRLPEATGIDSFAVGNQNVAGGQRSVALGSGATVNADDAFAIGRKITVSAPFCVSLGRNIISRVLGSVTGGIYNDDYINAGNEVLEISNLSDNSRMFSIGVGDNPSASPGNRGYYDGRGRVDGLYVTYRDGTHIRHGLSVDGYNASTGQYETVFEVDETGSIVKGSVSVDGSNLDAAGPDNAVQFNDNQNFGGSSDLTWDGRLNIGGSDHGEIWHNGRHLLINNTDSGGDIQFFNNGNFRALIGSDGTILGQGSLGKSGSRWSDIYGAGTLDIKAQSGQTDPLLELQDENGNTKVKATSGGKLRIKDGSYPLDIFGDSSNSVVVMDLSDGSGTSLSLRQYGNEIVNFSRDNGVTLHKTVKTAGGGVDIGTKNGSFQNVFFEGMKNTSGDTVIDLNSNPSVVIPSASGQTAPLLALQDENGTTRTSVSPSGSLVLSGAVTKGTTNLVSTDYTTTSTDYFIGVDTTTGAHAVTIRSADIEDGREIVIHDQGGNASGNNIQVQTEGSETISGAQYGSDLSSITMDTDHESVTLRGAIDNQSTGETNLYVV